MRSIKRHLSPGLAALAVLGFAGTAAAAPAPPDLVPFVDSEPDSTNLVAMSKWFVDTTASPYSASYHFGTQVANRASAGPFQIGAGAGPAGAPTAIQVIKDSAAGPNTTKTLSTVTLVRDDLGNGTANWRVNGIAKYTLTPPAGAAINSAIGPFCRVDDGLFEATAALETFTTAGCNALNSSTAAGLTSGISPGWQDVVAPNSDNSAFFAITDVTPGAGTFTATVDPGNEIDEVGDPNNNTVTKSIDIPGVNAQPATLTTQTTTPVSANLSAAIVAPNVLGRKLGQPTPAKATAVLTWALVSPAANGTATVDPVTGKASYTAKSGFTGADSFTFYAQDSRGLRSKTTTVTVNVTALPGTGGGTGTTGGGTTPPVVITKVTLKLKPTYAVVQRGSKTFVKVSGALPVSQAGRVVKIQRKAGKKVTTIATVKVGANGKFSKLVRVTTRTISVRTTIAASTTATSSTSAFKSLGVR